MKYKAGDILTSIKLLNTAVPFVVGETYVAYQDSNGDIGVRPKIPSNMSATVERSSNSGPYPPGITQWGACFELVSQSNVKIVFKVGDTVSVNEHPFTEHIFTVSRIDSSHHYFTSPTYQRGIECHCTNETVHKYVTLLGEAHCTHNWKLVQMFRFDEWQCTKCPKTKPFDIYEGKVS